MKLSGQHFKHREQGITLVELVVVVAVLAVLAVLLLPALEAATESSQMGQSISNLRQLVVANQSYASDHGSYCPADDRPNNRRWHGARASSSQPFDPACGLLAEYLGKSKKVGICPLFQALTRGENSFESGCGGYGYNASYIGGTPSWAYDSRGLRVAARPAQMHNAAATIMFTTSGYATGGSVQEYPYAEPPFWDFGQGPSGSRPSPTVHFRFRGHALVAWCDGRVTSERSVAREEGDNPHGGDAKAENLGWFGPEVENGFWNPQRTRTAP
jgi:type II secretory pathway pseudopilin PulG